MRFVDEYRAPEQVMQLIAHLKSRAALLNYTAARPLRIMVSVRRSHPRHF